MADAIEFLNDLLSKHQGIALGEDHESSEIFDFIGDNATNFKKMGIKTLYLEAILSEDNDKMIPALKKRDQNYIHDYFNKRRLWTPVLASDYERMTQKLNDAGIEVFGIDKITGTQRFQEANPHWLQTITEHNKEIGKDGKFLVLGGASHFGYVFGPGVNVELNIPAVDFEIKEGHAIPSADVSDELYYGRKVSDYTIFLPKTGPR